MDNGQTMAARQFGNGMACTPCFATSLVAEITVTIAGIPIETGVITMMLVATVTEMPEHQQQMLPKKNDTVLIEVTDQIKKVTAVAVAIVEQAVIANPQVAKKVAFLKAVPAAAFEVVARFPAVDLEANNEH